MPQQQPRPRPSSRRPSSTSPTPTPRRRAPSRPRPLRRPSPRFACRSGSSLSSATLAHSLSSAPVAFRPRRTLLLSCASSRANRQPMPRAPRLLRWHFIRRLPPRHRTSRPRPSVTANERRRSMPTSTRHRQQPRCSLPLLRQPPRASRNLALLHHTPRLTRHQAPYRRSCHPPPARALLAAPLALVLEAEATNEAASAAAVRAAVVAATRSSRSQPSCLNAAAAMCHCRCHLPLLPDSR